MTDSLNRFLKVPRGRNRGAPGSLFEHLQDAWASCIGRDRNAALADAFHLAVDQEVESRPEFFQRLINPTRREALQTEWIVHHQAIRRIDAIELIVNEIRDLHRVDVAELMLGSTIDHTALLDCCSLFAVETGRLHTHFLIRGHSLSDSGRKASSAGTVPTSL